MPVLINRGPKGAIFCTEGENFFDKLIFFFFFWNLVPNNPPGVGLSFFFKACVLKVILFTLHFGITVTFLNTVTLLLSCFESFLELCRDGYLVSKIH